MRVSVVIPTHNRAALVGESLRSVFSQTRPPEEILVVDDGSTDDTLERLKPLTGRIQLLRQQNAGAAAARNRGLRQATGDWIAFLDSDDLWEPEKLARQLEAAAAAPKASLVYCDSRPMDIAGRPLRRPRRPLHHGQVTSLLFQHVFVHTPAVMARAELLRELGGFDANLRVCEDYDLWLRASLLTPFSLVPEPLLLRRVHSQSLAHRDNPANQDQKCHVLERFAADPRVRALIPPAVIRRRLARVHFTAARAHRRHGDVSKAQEHLARTLALVPWNLRARWLQARTSLERSAP